MLSEVRLTVAGGYRLGAVVTLSSFLRHNPWFEGEVAIYATEHETHLVDEILTAIGRGVARQIPQPVVAAIEAACTSGDWVRERFLSLAMFGDSADGHVLMLDADLLFRCNVELFNRFAGVLLAAPEGASIAGRHVDWHTNAILDVRPETSSQTLAATFNAGVMCIDGQVLGPELLDEALGWVQSSTLHKLARRQHDQFVLNRVFAERWDPLESSHNFLLGHHQLLAQTGEKLTDAAVIHFNTEPRPWDLAGLHRARPEIAMCTGWWLTEYVQATVEAGIHRSMRDGSTDRNRPST